MPDQPSREEAARLLGITLPCSPGQVKRAYRRQARQHHPDRGGDARVFHALQRAFERLAEEETAIPRPVAGRPSRTPATTPRSPTRSELDALASDRDVPPGRLRLDTDLLSSALSRPHHEPVHPVQAASRAPGSALNRAASVLATDLTATLAIAAATDDLRRQVVSIEVIGGARRARKALESAPLEGLWTRRRRSSTTQLTSQVTVNGDRRHTAATATLRVARLLDGLGWPLSQWTLTPAEDGPA